MQRFILSRLFTTTMVVAASVNASSLIHAQTRLNDSTIQPSTVNTPSQLTLQNAVQLALQFHPDLRAAQKEISASEGSLRQAGLLPNPALTASIEDARGEAKSTTWQLNQAIEFGGKRGTRVAVAERNLIAAKNDHAIMLADIKASVSIDFFALLIAQERQRLALTSFDLTRRAYEAAKKQVTLGKVAPLEETKARIAQSSMQLELNQAEADVSLTRQKLSSQLSATANDTGQISGQFDQMPRIPEQAELDQQLRQAPQLFKAQIEVEKRLAMAQAERAKQIPDVTLSLGAKREPQTGRQQAIVGISLPIALFDRNQGNLQESLSRVDKAKDELASSEIRLRNSLNQIAQRLRSAHTETALMKNDILPNAQNVFELALKGFEYGKFNFLDVLDAQRSLLAAKNQYLRSCAEVHRAAAEMQALLAERDLDLYSAAKTL